MPKSPENVKEEFSPSAHPFGVKRSSDREEKPKVSCKVWENNDEKARKENEVKAVKNSQRSANRRKITVFNTTPDRMFSHWLCIGMAVVILLCTVSVIGLVWNMFKTDNLSRELEDVLKTDRNIKDLLLRTEKMEENDKLREEERQESEQKIFNLVLSLTNQKPFVFTRSMTDSTTSMPETMLVSTTTTSKTSKTTTTTTTKLPHTSPTVQTTVTQASRIPKTSFSVLQTMGVTYTPYNFLAVKVKVPSDGLSTSENWCKDYQYLCEHFSKRPTGCTGPHYSTASPFKECGEEYNSDMSIPDIFSCSPSSKMGRVAGQAFPEAKTSDNVFGFYLCGNNSCKKNITSDDESLVYMRGFLENSDTIMYTLCS